MLLVCVLVNLASGFAFHGTFFGTVNLVLAATKFLLPYQQDGWKCRMVPLRALLGRKRPLAEWAFTLAGNGFELLILFGALLARQ